MNFDDVVIGEKYIVIADENGDFSTYTDYPEAFILYAKSCDDEKVIKEMTSALTRYCSGISLNVGDILTCIGKFVDRDGCNIGLFDQGNERSFVLDTSFVTSLEKDCKKSKEKISPSLLLSCSEDEIFDIVNFIIDKELISFERLSDIIKRKGGCITVMNEIKENISLSDILKNYSDADINDITDAVENNFSTSDIKDIIMSLIDYAI